LALAVNGESGAGAHGALQSQLALAGWRRRNGGVAMVSMANKCEMTQCNMSINVVLSIVSIQLNENGTMANENMW